MFQVALQGIFLGLILSAFVGPVFFLLIQTSVTHGLVSALKLQTGIIISDICCILLAYSGMAQFINDPDYYATVGVTGGIILIAFGVTPFIFSGLKKKQITKEINLTPGNLLIKGFILNSTNPSVFIFWLGSISVANITFNGEGFVLVTYFAFALSTVFIIDFVKAYLAKYLKSFLDDYRLSIMNRAVSALFIVCGIYVVFKSFLHG